MTTEFLVKLSVTLKAVNNARGIPVRVGVNQNQTTVLVTHTETIHWEFVSSSRCFLTVALPDKLDQEAIVIEKVSFFGIEDPRFAWAGQYEPVYPEPWATEQLDQGIVLQSKLCPHTYLGWPGKWTLTFDVPVFTWIHNLQNLGWIYT